MICNALTELELQSSLQMLPLRSSLDSCNLTLAELSALEDHNSSILALSGSVQIRKFQ